MANQQRDGNRMNLEDTLGKMIHSRLGTESTRLLDRFKSRAPVILEERLKESINYERSRRMIWSEPLQLLETFIVISLELGEKSNAEGRPRAAIDKDLSFEVLTRLHGRACRIAQEVVLLLEGGFPSGAYARWRALHEVAVTSNLIRRYGNELATRYLEHESIERIDAMRVNQKHHEKTGMEPYSPEELARADEIEASLVKRFGKGFKSDYGWAASITGIGRPTFTDLEQQAGLAYLRPYYKLACDDIHAGARAIKFNIGVAGEMSDFILAGPTDAGMSYPGQNTAISLMQVNVSIVSRPPKTEDVVILGALQELSREVCYAFANTEKEQEERLSKERPTVEPATFRFIKP